MKVREFPMKNYYYEKVDKDIIDKVAEGCFGTPFTLEFKDPYQIKQKEVDELIESWKRYQSQGIITASPKEEITWIDMAEKDTIESYKQEQIDGILMGKSNYKMKMNRVELEMQRLRESTGENYMLNKMINTDGVEFFTEYTLYKDYNKYFGLTLDGESINIIEIMEEEFAEFLYHYRLSAIYPQVEAVHEDTWDITPEENEAIKEQMESGKTDKFTPVYDENDIEKQLVVDSKYDMTANSFSESYLKGPEMWTETPTNTGADCAKSWTETSTNTNPDYVEPWTSGTVSVGSGTISVTHIDMNQLEGLSITQHLENIQDGYILINNTESKSDQEKLAESVKFIESLLAQEEQVETKDSPTTLKDTENKSRAELITEIISGIIEELLTKGTCSLNITLGQEKTNN